MTIQQEVWWPDTCTCGVIEQWDDSVVPPVFTLYNYYVKDAVHSSLDDNTAYNAITSENSLKNTVFNTCLANAPARMVTTVNGVLTLAKIFHMAFTWSGTAPNRTITMSFVAANVLNILTAAELLTMQTAVNTAVGNGLATIANH